MVRTTAHRKVQRRSYFYNPPVINKELGIRRSALLEATDLASQLLANDIQTVVFGRTRQTVEVLLTYFARHTPGGHNSGDHQHGDRRPMTEEPSSPFAGQHAPPIHSGVRNAQSAIRGYRGGYLPNQRRQIEHGLRDGTVRTVVSTNALELELISAPWKQRSSWAIPARLPRCGSRRGEPGAETHSPLRSWWQVRRRSTNMW